MYVILKVHYIKRAANFVKRVCGFFIIKNDDNVQIIKIIWIVRNKYSLLTKQKKGVIICFAVRYKDN